MYDWGVHVTFLAEVLETWKVFYLINLSILYPEVIISSLRMYLEYVFSLTERHVLSPTFSSLTIFFSFSPLWRNIERTFTQQLGLHGKTFKAVLGRESKPTFGGEVLSAHNEQESVQFSCPSLGGFNVISRNKRMNTWDMLGEPVWEENFALRFYQNFHYFQSVSISIIQRRPHVGGDYMENSSKCQINSKLRVYFQTVIAASGISFLHFNLNFHAEQERWLFSFCLYFC